MNFEGIVGQPAAKELISRLWSAGRLPPALLFHGPDGVGKRTVALRLAAAMMCGDPGERPCGRCLACRKAAHGNHPDLAVVTRLPRGSARADDEGEEDGTAPSKSAPLSAFIRVDQIREIEEHARYGPREGRARVFVVDPADRMHPAAQNALLKTLEEPPGATILVLVSSRPHALLPTVRSRCLSVGFAVVPTDELARHLESGGMPADEAAMRAALSGGRPGHASSAEIEALAARREETLAALESLAEGPGAAAVLLEAASAFAGEDADETAASLEMAAGLLRDAARAAAGATGSLGHGDLAPRLAALGRRLGPGRAAALVETADRLSGLLRFNLNRTLVAESLLAAVAGGPIPV